MRIRSTLLAWLLLVAMTLLPGPGAAQFVGYGFTYQGELRQTGIPATGNFDFRFSLFGTDSGGSAIGGTLSRNNVQVSNGLFQVELDFGSGQFAAGDQQWLQIEVRPTGGGSFETLSPRTKLTAAPFAAHSLNALPQSVGSLAVLDGSLQGSDLSASAVGLAQVNISQIQARVSGVCAAGTAIRSIDSLGNVTCEAGAGAGVQTLTAGTGISLSGTTSNPIVSVANGSIGSSQINPSQVQARVVGSCLAGQYMQAIDAAGIASCNTAVANNAFWSTTGNSGLGTNTFLGTTDDSRIAMRVQNQLAFQIRPTTPLTPSNRPMAVNILGGIATVPTGVRGATIAGGGTDGIDPDFSTTNANFVTDHYGTVSGGSNNAVGSNDGNPNTGAFATVSGGIGNVASDFGATVSGGTANQALMPSSWVAGGDLNVGNGRYASVAGGYGNTAAAHYASVAGGAANCSGAEYSWTGGRFAKVRYGSSATTLGLGCASPPEASSGTPLGDSGTYVWADSIGSPFVSSGPNQYLVRATGGVAFNTNVIPEPVDLMVSGKTSGNADLFLRPKDTDFGFNFGVQTVGASAVMYIARWDGVGAYQDLAVFNTDNSFQVFGNAIKPGGGSWSVPSDARFKEHIQPLNHALDRLLALRGVNFHYRNEIPDGYYAQGEQTGFIAQEVEQVFPEWVQEDERGFKLVGPRGFEALTVEALRELNDRHAREIATLKQEHTQALTRQAQEIAALREQVQALFQTMNTP